jgi:hypothetical protein
MDNVRFWMGSLFPSKLADASPAGCELLAPSGFALGWLMPRVSPSPHRPWVGLVIILAGITLAFTFRRPQPIRSPDPPRTQRAHENVAWRVSDFTLQLGPSNETSPAASFYASQGESADPAAQQPLMNGSPAAVRPLPLESRSTPPELSTSYRTALNRVPSRPLASRVPAPIPSLSAVTSPKLRSDAGEGQLTDDDSRSAESALPVAPLKTFEQPDRHEADSISQQADTRTVEAFEPLEYSSTLPAVTLGLPLLDTSPETESNEVACAAAEPDIDAADDIRLALRNDPPEPPRLAAQPEPPRALIAGIPVNQAEPPATSSFVDTTADSQVMVPTTNLPAATAPSGTAPAGFAMPRLNIPPPPGYPPFPANAPPIAANENRAPTRGDDRTGVHPDRQASGNALTSSVAATSTISGSRPEPSSAAELQPVVTSRSDGGQVPPNSPAENLPPPQRWLLHTISDGDSLPALSRRYFGAEDRWQVIFNDNSDLLTDPELLPIGAKLRIRRDSARP